MCGSGDRWELEDRRRPESLSGLPRPYDASLK